MEIILKILVTLALCYGVVGAFLDAENDGQISFDEMAYMNLTADPCEDFYEFTCGNFKNLQPIQEGEKNIDQFSILEDNLITLANNILALENEETDPEALKKARTAYKACMDEENMDSSPLYSPEIEVADRYGGFPLVGIETPDVRITWNDIADLSADYGIPLFLTVSSYYDTLNATKNVLRIDNDGMTVPDQIRPKANTYDDIIEKSFEKFATKPKILKATTKSGISAFELFLTKIVTKIREIRGSYESDEATLAKIANISNFMKGIHFGGVVPEDVEITELNKESETPTVTLERLNEWTKENFGETIQLDWVEYVKRIFKYTYVEINKNTEVLVGTTTGKTLYGILNWVRMNDVAVVKSAALLRVFVYMAADSDGRTRRDFDSYLSSIKKNVYPRWEYCTRKIADYNGGTVSLSFALTYEYQLRYFNVNKLQDALLMIRDLQASFREIVEEADWMDEPSKVAALEKVDNMVTLLGFPDFLMSKESLDHFYSNLQICSWNNYENAKNIRAFKQAYQLNMFSKRSRFSWEKSPFDVNAYYNRANNRIIFPVAVLNPIFFGGSVGLLDYSRIGSIIGHEITHGFDMTGMLYDQNGNINITNRWWTMETTQNFVNKTYCFIDQYSQYPIEPLGVYVNGSTTLNENLADNGGTRTSFRALQKLIPRTAGVLPYTETFTPEQLFFVGFGTMWCNNESPAYLQAAQSCTGNCHAMSKWRVNGVVSNMEEFAQAFNCPVASRMNPDTKCKLW